MTDVNTYTFIAIRDWYSRKAITTDLNHSDIHSKGG